MTYTAAILGAGSGGLTAAVGLTTIGKSVALIESGHVGGDCTNVGCIPSKALIHLSRNRADDPLAKVRAKRDHLRQEETIEYGSMDNVTLIHGHGRITAPGHVSVALHDGTTRHIEAKHIVIATGSSPRRLSIAGLPDDRLLTSDNVWDLDATPGHLAIVGAGPIGLEMASAFKRLGTRVTIIDVAPRVLSNEDPEASDIMLASLRDQSIDVRLGVGASSYDEATSALMLSDGSRVEYVDSALIAIGRVPRLDDLGLDDVGVSYTNRGIVADTWGATSVDDIWAIGDVTGNTLTTHGASATGRRLMQTIGYPALPRIGSAPTIPNATFSEPEVASVGLTMDELADRYPDDARLHLRADLSDTDRGYTDDISHGAVIVDVERLTGKILRATIVGPAAAESISLFTLAIDQDISMHKLFRLVYPYPTYGWAISEIADEFTRQTLPNLGAETRAWLTRQPERIVRRLRRLG